jgi:hypothetical protein
MFSFFHFPLDQVIFVFFSENVFVDLLFFLLAERERVDAWQVGYGVSNMVVRDQFRIGKLSSISISERGKHTLLFLHIAFFDLGLELVGHVTEMVEVHEGLTEEVDLVSKVQAFKLNKSADHGVVGLFKALIVFEQLNYHVVLGVGHVLLLGLHKGIKRVQVALHVVDGFLDALLNFDKFMDGAEASILRGLLSIILNTEVAERQPSNSAIVSDFAVVKRTKGRVLCHGSNLNLAESLDRRKHWVMLFIRIHLS